MLLTIFFAARAAIRPMLTTSWLSPFAGTLWMLAGEQRVRFSATSAVAGYCAPAKPQRRPGFFATRNSGSVRFRCGLSSRFRRRSEITPTCVAAMAR